MTIQTQFDSMVEVSCANCEACCCRLEVLLITHTGVPDQYIQIDEWGGMTMERLDDGWCAALDRKSMRCKIYQKRPWVCREFEMGAYECLIEREACMKVQESSSTE